MMGISFIYPWINFAIFIGLLFYFLREPFKDFLGDRREKLRKELDEVAQGRLQAETSFKECRKKLAEADKVIERLKEELRQEGELEKEILIRRAKEYAQKIRADAGLIANQELARAREELRKTTLLLALELARKKLEQVIEPADHERLMVWGMDAFSRGAG